MVLGIHEQGGGDKLPRGYMLSTKKKADTQFFYVLGYIPRLGYIALRLGTLRLMNLNFWLVASFMRGGTVPPLIMYGDGQVYKEAARSIWQLNQRWTCRFDPRWLQFLIFNKKFDF